MDHFTTITLKTKLAIFSAALLSFVGILVETSMNVTFPTLIHDFHITLSAAQWVTTGYLLLVTLVMSCTAFVLKRFASRHIFIFAVAAFIIGSLLCAAAPNFPVLLSGRLLQAISAGLSTPLMLHIILTKIPPQKTGTYVGLANTVIALAPALGPAYGGVLTAVLSWRYIFWIVLPVGLAVFIIGLSSIDMQASDVSQSFDYLGLILLSGILTGFVFAFNQAGIYGWSGLPFAAWLLISLIFVVALAARTRFSGPSLLNFSILRNERVRLGAFNYFSLPFINIGISFVLPIYSQIVLGQDAQTAGLLLLPGALLGAFISPFAGKLLDKFGGFRLIFAGNCMMTIGSLLFWLFTDALTPIWLLCFYLFLCIGFNFSFGNTMANTSLEVSKNEKADVNALFSTLQQYAGSIGTAVLAALITISQNHRMPGTTEAVRTRIGGHHAFILLTILGVLATLSVLRGEYVRRKRQERMRNGQEPVKD